MFAREPTSFSGETFLDFANKLKKHFIYLQKQPLFVRWQHSNVGYARGVNLNVHKNLNSETQKLFDCENPVNMPFLLAPSEKLYVFKTPWFTGFWGCWKLLKARKFIVTTFAHAQTLGCCVIYQLLGYITYVIYSIWISPTHWVDPCITNSSSLPTSVTEGKKNKFRGLDH